MTVDVPEWEPTVTATGQITDLGGKPSRSRRRFEFGFAAKPKTRRKGAPKPARPKTAKTGRPAKTKR